ncbi:DUF4241 domain-containing protein [Hymenobacter canadensis]|uniref:DUF4241 domain-containing protein n=1 Tax=Hymenobacter canadensis TaxID=2999067 RepID=A0ABY7LM07_9BACT|nr:DUF4241 domain-containing protein [Hymenobacter canadensis]WBA40947.1 DUF4241 domain-containing protein [Hymenobacter canadensis]
MLHIPYLILLLLWGCSPASSSPISGHVPTISRAPYEVVAEPKAFETSFFPGTHLLQDSMEIHLEPEFLGNLAVQSGKLVATDPVTFHEQVKPFATQFPRGRFPVELAIASLHNDHRVAFARILFSANPVKKWELALLPGQKPLPLRSEEYYGFSVDGGTALFLDAASTNRFTAHLRRDRNAYKDMFITGFESQSEHPRNGFLYAIRQDTLATFSTGFGDGFYATYIGFDDDHKPCRLLIDFQIVEWQ